MWTIKGGGGWTHPVHVHFEEGIILSRGGKAPPEWEKWARKDMYRIGPEIDSDRHRDRLPLPGLRRDVRGALPQHPARGPRHAAALGRRASGAVHC